MFAICLSEKHGMQFHSTFNQDPLVIGSIFALVPLAINHRYTVDVVNRRAEFQNSRSENAYASQESCDSRWYEYKNTYALS
jgi:hypothetical protein